MRMFNPPHPGLVILDMMGDRTVSEVAEELGVARCTLSRVINGKAAISADLAFRLSQVFGPYTETWLEMQAVYDAWQIEHREDRPILSRSAKADAPALAA